MVVQRAQASELLRERRARDLELRLVGDLAERAPLARQLRVQRGQRLLSGGIDEERRDVVRELVAGRPFDRPVAQTLARLEDLLDPDVRDAARTQPLQILAGIREPVGMVDAQAVDEALRDELEHLGVRRLEHVRVLDPHAGQLADVEEAAVPAGGRIPVEEPRPQLAVPPEWVLPLVGGHVVRDDVQDHTQAGLVGGLAHGAELGLAPELLRDPGRVDDVVAVRRARPRLERGREVEMRHAELAEIGQRELARRTEAELLGELQPVRAAEVRHA